MVQKPKVAFVCVHNSCRSQIAEALGKLLSNIPSVDIMAKKYLGILNGFSSDNRIIGEAGKGYQICWRNVMKKVLSGILSIAIALSMLTATAFAAGPSGGRYFADLNNDGICDNAGSRCAYVDADGDGVCDTCGSGQGCGYGRGARGGHGNGFRGERGR